MIHVGYDRVKRKDGVIPVMVRFCSHRMQAPFMYVHTYTY